MGILGENIGLVFKVRADGSEGRKELDRIFKDVKGKSDDIAATGGNAFGKLSNATENFTSKIGALSAGLPLVGAGIASVATVAAGAVAGLFQMARQTAELGAEVQRFATLTGFSVKTISALQIAAQQAGTSIDEIEEVFESFVELMIKAGQGADDAKEKVKSLGLEPQSAYQDLESSFLKVLDKIREMPTQAGKAKIAMDGMGESGLNMIKVAAQMEGGTAAYISKLKEMGLVMDDEGIKKSKEFNAILGKTSLQISGITREFSYGFMPAFTSGMNDVSGMLENNQKNAQKWGENIGNTLSGIIWYWNQATLAAKQYFGASTNENQPSKLAQLGGILDWTRVFRSKGEERSREVAAQKFNTDLANSENAMPGVREFVPTDKNAPKPNDRSFLSGSGKTGKSAGKAAGDNFDKEFREFAKEFDFRVSRTFGGNVQGKKGGSLHPAGLAGDLKIGGKSTAQIVEVLAGGIQKGWRALDERFVGALPGVKSTGPNAHFEKNPRRPSMFIEDRPDLYGGQDVLDYLKELDKKRLNKTSSADDLAEFRKKRVEDEKKANEETVRSREEADERVLAAARNRAKVDKATLDQLLESKLISEKNYADQIAENELNLIRTEKAILEERFKMSELSGDQRLKLETEIASLASEIQVKSLEKGTDAIKRQNEELEKQKAISEEILNLRREVEESEREIVDFRKEQERKVLSNTAETSYGQERLDALVVLREFDIKEAERRKNRADADALTIFNREIADLERRAEKDIELKKRVDEEKIELDKLYKNRLLISEEEFQAQKKDIEDSYQKPLLDAEAGMFGVLANGIAGHLQNVMLVEDANGRLEFSFAKMFESIAGMGVQAFGSIAQGFGEMVGNWVLYGDTGGQTLRKLFAGVLAQVAQVATTYAVMSLAAAAFASTAFGAAILGGSPGEFLAAAALWGSVAVAAGVAGRLVAGNSFSASKSGVSGGVSNQTSANSANTAKPDQTRTIIENRASQPQQVIKEIQVIEHRHTLSLEDGIVEKQMRRDYETNGWIYERFKNASDGVNG